MPPQTPRSFTCRFCGRRNFKTQHALNRHLKQSFCGREASSGGNFLIPLQAAQNPLHDTGGNTQDLPHFPPGNQPKKRALSRINYQVLEPQDLAAITTQIDTNWGDFLESDQESIGNSGGFDYLVNNESALESENTDTNEDQKPPAVEVDSTAKHQNPGIIEANTPPPDSDSTPDVWIRDQFKAYCAHAKQHFAPFTEHEKEIIRLLHLLKDKNAPLNAFEPVMLWHLIAAKKLHPHQTLRDYVHYKGRKAIIEKLARRYNYENKLPYRQTFRLPVSGATVSLTLHNTKATIQRLLTNPRIKGMDYCFWDQNPFQRAPENLDYVSDLHTGAAFFETQAFLCRKEGDVLLPVTIYSDGTAVSQFHDMEIIQVNIALGILTREARNKPHNWAPLGYIEKIHEQGGRGRAILHEANHLETQDGAESSDNSYWQIDGVGINNAQDFHAMMHCVLRGLVQMQDHGFLWDHYDPVNKQLYPDVHYHIFVPFIKADTKEADLFCGKYGQRFSAQQICRKCHIPLQEADDHLAKYPLKTVKEISKLVERSDYDGLRRLSQTYLTNAFYELRFSTGNNRGVHGSCPSEMLHAFLLGTFKYLRDIFFEQIGPESEGARVMNALSAVYSKLFGHQSDRTMPGTGFTKGINVGKLMGKDYRGVLLVMLAMFRSNKGQAVLRTYQNFKHEGAIDDWILLLELMLEWESYLNEPLMYKKHVKRLEKKHRVIMYIMRKVAKRSKGMGLKLAKFHMILHIWEDILQFGVPLEYDTSANESMHKPSKKASKMTQRAADTFNFQTATRLIEFELLDLAMEEIENGHVPWDYYTKEEKKRSNKKKNPVQAAEISTGEAGIQVFWDENGESSFQLLTRSRFRSKTTWNSQVIQFLLGLQDLVEDYIATEYLSMKTCHARNGQSFRGHPNFRGKGVWRDWVWVDWGDYGHLPSHIWCFVILEGMPTGRNGLEYGGISLKDGTYAVVETAVREEEDGSSSELMSCIRKEVEFDEQGTAANRSFYLADTEAFLDPACVIPDIGGPPNQCFVVRPRNQWADLFVNWVEEAHKHDDIEDDNVQEDQKVP